MTRYQNTVIWLGLVLIALNLVIHIADLKHLLFGGTVSGKAEGNPVQAPQGQAQTPQQNQVPTPTPNPSPSPPAPSGGTPIVV
jgi:hypothetical protein